MSASFWIVLLVMAGVAISFVAAPLIQYERRFGSAGIATALPLFTVGLYLVVGSPQAADLESPSHAPTRPAADLSSSKKKSVGSVASMVEGLASRLREDPDDGKGWLLLARSYKHLNRLPEAQEAYQQAALLGEFDADLAAVATPRTAEPSGGVSGRVESSQRAAALALPTDIVFVFARAVGGSTMPVAVLQRPVAELPFEFQLNDSHSISAGVKLSDYDRVVITARITRAGDAKNALQGLQARSEELVIANHQPVNLMID